MDAQQLHQLFLKQGEVSTDSRAITKGSLFFALSGANFNGNTFAEQALEKGASYVIVDDPNYYKEADSRYLLVKDSLKALQELATTHRNYCKTPMIALTGSNGKTTTKELIHAVLKTSYNTLATEGNFNNHIGVPLTLLRLTKETELAIVEMGANHRGEIQQLASIAQPNYGYITNFGMAHLEGFGSKEGVIKGKSELYDYLRKEQQWIFYNPKDAKQIDLLKDDTRKIATASDQCQIHSTKELLELSYKGQLLQSQLVGSYNADNIAAAIGMGIYFKVPFTKIKAAIEGYVPKNNRSELLKKGSNLIILDAYNANPSSMKAALDNFQQLNTSKQKVLILGSMLELGSYSKKAHQELIDQANQITNKLYLVGKEFKELSRTSFENTKALQQHLKQHPLTDSYLLIKGSRGIALEQLLEDIN